MRFYRDLFTESWNPTSFELFDKTVHVDGQDYDLEMWDTSGCTELHQLERLSYLTWDAVFLCFSVNSDKKFAHAQTKVLRLVLLSPNPFLKKLSACRD
jgi:GTPase SAR1 family protein